MGVAPPARPAPPAEIRELDTAGLAVARGGEAREECHRRGRGHRLERVSAHASPAGENAPRTRKPGRGNTRGGRQVSVLPRRLWATPPRSVDAPLVELQERQSTAVLAMSNGAPPTASGIDVIDGQVGSGVGGTPVARAPVAALATPGAEHALAEAPPGPRAVLGVVSAAIGLPGVLGAATTRTAGDDTTDRAQLHPRIVGGDAGAVYSPAVLGVRGQARSESETRVELGGEVHPA